MDEAEQLAAQMRREQASDPLHGVTLEQLVTRLVEHYGWEGLAERINIRCFSNDPSVKSCLKFLRKTPWAREKVEGLYVAWQRGAAQRAKGG